MRSGPTPMQNIGLWAPQHGPQQVLVDCPLPEVFFGGARGGGKTDGVLGKWAIKERRYGRAFNAVEPDQLRGPQHDAAFSDELAKWR